MVAVKTGPRSPPSTKAGVAVPPANYPRLGPFRAQNCKSATCFAPRRSLILRRLISILHERMVGMAIIGLTLRQNARTKHEHAALSASEAIHNRKTDDPVGQPAGFCNAPGSIPVGADFMEHRRWISPNREPGR